MTDQKRVLITGGCGFVGSALIRHIIRRTNCSVVNLDKLTYAAMPEALEECAESERYYFVRGDVADAEVVRRTLATHAPDGLIHLAAESHVDRSIDGPEAFIRTNVMGTFVLLEETRKFLEGRPKDHFKFHHVSTDEVYGSLSESEPAFRETTPYNPRSPYAASKAASDHLALAWHETYKLPVILTNCSNNYGPWQFPEKFVPVMVLSALDGKSLPVYGTGQNIRDWLFVEDHAAALWAVFSRGKVGQKYNIGGKAERRNLDVVRTICAILNELRPRTSGKSYYEQISFVADRPGHDYRYGIDCSRISHELGWRPCVTFEEGLRKTVQWYLDKDDWWRSIQAKTYDGGRLGIFSQ